MIDEQTYEHQWTEGEWFRRDKGDRYLSRDDVCELCGCERSMIKFKKRGCRTCKQKSRVVSYNRSKQVYGHNSMPDCWGAKNPQ